MLRLGGKGSGAAQGGTNQGCQGAFDQFMHNYLLVTHLNKFAGVENYIPAGLWLGMPMTKVIEVIPGCRGENQLLNAGNAVNTDKVFNTV
ncbi:MAG: hypothetical protein R3E89_14520 [Thiolinea sp.]